MPHLDGMTGIDAAPLPWCSWYLMKTALIGPGHKGWDGGVLPSLSKSSLPVYPGVSLLLTESHGPHSEQFGLRVIKYLCM